MRCCRLLRQPINLFKLISKLSYYIILPVLVIAVHPTRMTTGYIILAEATTDTTTRGVSALADDDIVVCDATEARRRCDMLTGKVGSMPKDETCSFADHLPRPHPPIVALSSRGP